MTERGAWGARLGYCALAAVLVAAPLLPLDTVPRGYAAPDLLLAVTLAFAARRPDALPVALVAGVFLLADLLFQRPPGLYAALAIAATEWLRRRAPRLARGGLGEEWLAVGACVVAVGMANRLLLGAFMVPQARWGLTIIQVVLTAAAYPLVAGLAAVAGLRRAAEEGGR